MPPVGAGVEIHPCRREDVPYLKRFIHEQWESDHVLSRDHTLFDWQFDPTLPSPTRFSGPTVVVATEEARIVGMLGITGFEFNVRGATVPGAWTANWIATPDVRGHNVAVRLMKAVSDLGFEVIGGLGVTPQAARVLRALRFEVFELDRWVAVFDVQHTTQLLLAAAEGAVTADEARSAVERCTLVRGATAAGFEVLDWNDQVAAQWDDAWRTHFASALIGGARDARYIKWRYVNHPTFEYHVRCVRQTATNDLEGLTVFRVESPRGRDERVLRIVEFLALPKAAEALAGAVTHFAWEHEVGYADFHCSSAAWAEGLERVGFRREDLSQPIAALPSRMQPLEPPGRTITVALLLPKEFRGRREELAASGELYVTKSDADQDRPN